MLIVRGIEMFPAEQNSKALELDNKAVLEVHRSSSLLVFTHKLPQLRHKKQAVLRSENWMVL